MDFKTITDIIFKNKSKWSTVTNEDKEKNFFIFNRFMAKKHPKQSQYFNQRQIDKATAMDIWFQFLKTTTYTPRWFWTGSTKRKEPKIKDWKLLNEFDDLSLNDINILCEFYPTEVKEEIKKIIKIKKEI